MDKKKRIVTFQLSGKLLEAFEQECKDEYRGPTDELKMILEKYFMSKGIDINDEN